MSADLINLDDFHIEKITDGLWSGRFFVERRMKVGGVTMFVSALGATRPDALRNLRNYVEKWRRNSETVKTLEQ